MLDPIIEFQKEFRFLSNFWPCKVILDDLEFPSVEHAYQAAKTLHEDLRRSFQTLKTPGEAKKYGKAVVLRLDWEQVRLSIMEDLVRQKFTKDDLLKKKLLATGDAHLQEGNYWRDEFWGVNLTTNRGKNHLGKILMKIRSELKVNSIQ